jgi:ribonuclease HI
MEWCWVYSLYLLESDSNEAELLAVVKALELCSSREDMFGRNIIVESDSANVVNWMLKPCNRPWYYHELFILASQFFFFWKRLIV